MNKSQRRLAAIALCIAGIIGTLMAGKDAAARRSMEAAPSQMEASADAGTVPSGGGN